MEKIEREGKVAVLISPGFGAGWSTWNREHADALCMDARIVGPFLAGGAAAAVQAAADLFPDIYTGGGHKLRVEWVTKGAAFEVEEYDGSESLHVLGDRTYLVA